MALATDAVSVALAYLSLPNDDGSVVVARDERLALPALGVRTLTGQQGGIRRTLAKRTGKSVAAPAGAAHLGAVSIARRRRTIVRIVWIRIFVGISRRTLTPTVALWLNVQ